MNPLQPNLNAAAESPSAIMAAGRTGHDLPQGSQAVDCAKMRSSYANTCRLALLPEELLLDFGINIQSTVANPLVTGTDRVVTSWYTAKRLLHVLQMSIEHYEMTFGAIEMDVRRRSRVV